VFDRRMGGPLGPIAIRPWLEIRFKDGLQQELERSLDDGTFALSPSDAAALMSALADKSGPAWLNGLQVCLKKCEYFPTAATKVPDNLFPAEVQVKPMSQST
jgi:hypothetical protein